MLNRFTHTVLALSALALIGPSAAFAQADRTWVSGVGDDANPCTRTAPCKTFQGAISKTSSGGEINTLDSGGYGAVTITKSMTINGAGQGAAILSSGTNGIIINAGSTHTVRLLNLQINGLNNNSPVGIRLIGGASLVVDNVQVHGFQTGIDAQAGDTFITRSLITNNTTAGVHANGGAVTIENSTLTKNNVAGQATGALRISKSDVFNNLGGFGCGGTLASAGNNRKAGNAGAAVALCSPTTAVTVF
jgi:hypothetical protein